MISFVHGLGLLAGPAARGGVPWPPAVLLVQLVLLVGLVALVVLVVRQVGQVGQLWVTEPQAPAGRTWKP
ncbi:hypothetical protein GCM10009738_46390 [Kitasatospora viridis]